MHESARRFVAQVRQMLPTAQSVVEIGGRDVNGSVRPLFTGSDYTSIDLVAGQGVDVVADGATYRPDRPVDVVVCCEVLEHTPDAAAIVANAREMLIGGGVLIVTAATPERIPHGCDGGPVGGEFYRGINPEQLRGWLAGFSACDVDPVAECGDVYAWGIR